VKFLEPVLEGFASYKKIKYWQPPDTLPQFYLPPLVDWKRVSINTGLDIIFTEGEKKAARACVAGYNCISIGGVWAWRSAKKGKVVIDDFEAFQWSGRKVYLCFDSDMYSNPMVVQALYALSMELLQLGAHVFTIQLEPDKHIGEKVGMDDFMEAHGNGAFRKLLENPNQTKEFRPSSALWQLNEKIAVIRDKVAVMELETGILHRNLQLLTQLSFGKEEYAVADGSKITAKNAAKEWLRWKPRREHLSISYAPGDEQVLPGNVLNTWRGWGIEPEKGSAKQLAPFYRLIDFVFAGYPDRKEWFLKWLAYPLQFPGTKMMQASVIWSAQQGMGKSFIAYIMGDIYGPNFGKITQRELQSRFNSWAAHKQFILGEEIVGVNLREDAAYIKELVTQETIYVNAKHQPEYEIPDRANLYFTSNHADAMFVERHDRRFFVHQIEGQPMSQQAYREIDAWRREGGAKYVFYHLLHDIDVTDFSPKAPALMTHDKEIMINTGKSDLDAFVDTLIENPSESLVIDNVRVDRDLFNLNEIRLFMPEHLSIRNPTNVALGKALRRAGIACRMVKTIHGVRDLYMLRNEDRWKNATSQELSAHYGASKKYIDTGGVANEKSKFEKKPAPPKVKTTKFTGTGKAVKTTKSNPNPDNFKRKK
jgi:hypothetical protein